MTGDRTWYVIAAWGGPRRKSDRRYEADRSYYLRGQVAQLNHLKHDVERVLVMVPECSKETKEFKDYLRYLAELPKWTVIRRPNAGLSYGSYSDAFASTVGEGRDHPDWWIFTEDDYVPVLDNFDREMCDMFRELPRCGYLCGAAWKGPHDQFPFHAGMSVGISTHEIWLKVFREHGMLPHQKSGDGYAAMNQVNFARPVIKLGLRIMDVRSKFCVIYYKQSTRAYTFHEKRLPALWAPLQKPEYVTKPSLRHRLSELILSPIPEVQE